MESLFARLFVPLLAALAAAECGRLWGSIVPTATDCTQHPARESSGALAEYPFICGVQEVAAPEANSPLRIFAYTQPSGGWCWSNGGLIVDTDARTFSIIDAATDVRLTQRMVDAYRPLVRGYTPKFIILTHADIDHIYGLDRLATMGKFEAVVAHEATALAMSKQPNPQGFAASIKRGRFLYALLSKAPLRHLLAVLPESARGIAVSLLGKLRMMESFSPFDFASVTQDTNASMTFGERAKTLNLGSRATVVLHKVDGAHSTGDTFVHVPERNVVFAGDLLFIGVSPVMWAGPAEKFIAGLHELLATGATLFVPGHGPITDRDGVSMSIAYWEHVMEGSAACYREGLDAHACGSRLLASLPDPWRAWLHPERVFINAAVQLAHLRGSPGDVDKFQLVAAQGAHLLPWSSQPVA